MNVNVKSKNFRNQINIHKEVPIRTSKGFDYQFGEFEGREFEDVFYIDTDKDGQLDVSWSVGGTSISRGTIFSLKTDEPVFKNSLAELKDFVGPHGEGILKQGDVPKVELNRPYCEFQSGGLLSGMGKAGGPFWSRRSATLTRLVENEDSLPPDTKWAIDFGSSSVLLYSDKA